MTGTGEARSGFALAAVIMMAVIFSVFAYGVLSMVLGARQRAQFHETRLRAKYATEAALVWAQQRLWRNNGECFPGPSNFTIDGIVVDVIVTPTCTASNRQLSARVSYTPIPR
ncbi:MAG: hypothetical protein HYZ92_03015 [Candidatus Omnitrophica bacterium]|nr:hypothetical protein [Candidatus Omnitrophota bacterium]